MTVRQIVTTPDPVLRKKAHKVTDFGKEFQDLVNDMIETMRDAPGVGLAAPQIGISQQLVVIEYGEETEEVTSPKLYVLVNPEIISKSEEKVVGIEGCLSVPELVGEVERHNTIVVKGLNRHGKPAKIKVDEWLARICQHEIDHLDGILYTDLTDKVWKPGPDEDIPLD